VGNHPYHRLPHVHTTIPGKHRESDAEESNPRSRSAFTDYG